MPDATPTLPGTEPTSSTPPPDAKKAPAATKKAAGAGGADELPGAALGGKKPRGRGRPSLKSRLTELVQTLAGALTVGATMGGSDRLAYDAEVLANNAERLADQLDRLAQNNPAVKRALESLLSFSDSADLITTVSVVLIPICANHGLLPAGAAVLVGAPEPPPRPIKPEVVEPNEAPAAEPEPEPDQAARIFASLRSDRG